MANIKIIDDLKELLQQPLPGWDAQKTLMPEGRDQMSIPDDLCPAAVLIALYPDQQKWHFPLIKRSVDGFAHSGQIALPGGRREASETDIETALREAEEEVSLPSQSVQILGKTSPLPIPVSKYIVQPVVGFMRTIPTLRPDPREVDHIFSMSLNELTETQVFYETRHFNNSAWEIPYFEIQGYKVWGATAMMLSEFRELVSKII